MNQLEPIYKEINKSFKSGDFAVFDFDNTCIVNDIGDIVFNHIARNNLFKNGDSRLIFKKYHKDFQIINAHNFKDAYEFQAKTLSGFTKKEVEEIFVRAIKEEGEEIGKAELFGIEINKGIKIRKHVIELMDFIRKDGIAIWIITASPEIVIRAALDYFKINASLIGVRNVVADGKLTAELEIPVPIAGGKVECIKKYINPTQKPLFGIGDSINDLPMLEYCKIKAVVDRKNELTKIAKENKWFII